MTTGDRVRAFKSAVECASGLSLRQSLATYPARVMRTIRLLDRFVSLLRCHIDESFSKVGYPLQEFIVVNKKNTIERTTE